MKQEVVRITLSNELKKVLKRESNKLGIKETEYVKSLIIEDLKSREKLK